mmetsp:Transcript_35202/g.74948  ORF Transcript_35202/g.74948 Transcript_35202/m.74948 type:complete len:291 (+) Transcript_35202:117-989(+)
MSKPLQQLDQFCRNAHWQKALSLVRSEPGLQKNLVVCGKLAGACCRDRRPDVGAAVLKEFKEKYKLMPDTAVFNQAMGSSLRADLWQEALRFHRLLQEESLQPTTITYNSLMRAWNQASAWQRMLTVFEAMGNSRGVKRSIVSYTEAVSGSSRASQWMEVGRLLEGMRKEDLAPDLIIYNTCLSAVAKGRCWEASLALQEQMRQQLVRPDVVSYSAIIEVHEQAHRWEDALALLGSMRNEDVEPDLVCIEACMTACSRASQPWYAKKLLREQGKRIEKLASVFKESPNIR